jgi:hypothetical protein
MPELPLLIDMIFRFIHLTVFQSMKFLFGNKGSRQIGGRQSFLFYPGALILNGAPLIFGFQKRYADNSIHNGVTVYKMRVKVLLNISASSSESFQFVLLTSSFLPFQNTVPGKG